jgi:hypothetical protein
MFALRDSIMRLHFAVQRPYISDWKYIDTRISDMAGSCDCCTRALERVIACCATNNASFWPEISYFTSYVAGLCTRTEALTAAPVGVHLSKHRSWKHAHGRVLTSYQV